MSSNHNVLLKFMTVKKLIRISICMGKKSLFIQLDVILNKNQVEKQLKIVNNMFEKKEKKKMTFWGYYAIAAKRLRPLLPFTLDLLFRFRGFSLF